MCGINQKREVKNFHKCLAGLAPLMKTSAKMCGAWEEKATLLLQDIHVVPLERMLQIQNVYFANYFFFAVVRYGALVLSLAVSLLS